MRRALLLAVALAPLMLGMAAAEEPEAAAAPAMENAAEAPPVAEEAPAEASPNAPARHKKRPSSGPARPRVESGSAVTRLVFPHVGHGGYTATVNGDTLTVALPPHARIEAPAHLPRSVTAVNVAAGSMTITVQPAAGSRRRPCAEG